LFLFQAFWASIFLKLKKELELRKIAMRFKILFEMKQEYPHASNQAKLFAVSSSTSDLKKNELSWVIDYGATQHMTSNRILTQLNLLSILVMILATKYKAVRK
jgi:hypothetical protein